jgi:nucleoside-diphosphate-sugar epimerase
MKYLVLGSAGVIGHSLTQYLKSLGKEVLTFDIEADSSEDLRIFNNSKLEKYVKECDFIFFLAWDVGGSVYLQKYQDTYEFIDNNLRIIVNTFDVIKKYNKPFIFASSQMANMSYSTYGITKALAEKIVASLNGITVKFWNVYGPEHDLEKSHVITDFILKAKHNKIIDMRTDGTELRQMLYSDDCAECLFTLSKKYDELSRAEDYHITSFEWVSVLEIANLIAEKFPDTKIVPSVSKDMGQMDKRNEPNPSILKYWKPKVTLEEGITNIINQLYKKD